MSVKHVLIALFAVVAWAVNFPVTTLALEQFTPMMIVALRYTLVAIPTLVFVRPPSGEWKWLVVYGLTYGVFQFGAVYWGMHLGAPSGVAALLIQSSAPFTVILGCIFLQERLHRALVVGLVVAVVGLLAIATVGGTGFGGLPALLVVLGGAGWAAGNIIMRYSGIMDVLRFSLWMTVVPPIPALLVGFALDGVDESLAGFSGLLQPTGLRALAALGYIAFVATLAATASWLYVLARNPASRVAPLTLLMPVLALVIGWVALDERPSVIVIVMTVLILAGVAMTTVHPRRRSVHRAGLTRRSLLD